MSTFIQAKLKEGSILGGSLLLAGSCIGAGMLALPVVTGVCGFFPSMVMFILAWLFMALSGQLLLTINLSLGYHLNLLSLLEKILGKKGKWAGSCLFIFLFYSLSVAYIAALGPICQMLIADLFGLCIRASTCQIFLSSLFGFILYRGVKPVDVCNRFLMLGLGCSYIALLSAGAVYISPKLLISTEWKYAFSTLPVLIVSFGYHNMIPSLTQYFKGDEKRLKIALWLGTCLPLIVYLLWQLFMLGVIPKQEILQALHQGEAATTAFQRVVGKGWINIIGQLFAFFAIVTSLLAQSLSLVDFIADGLRVSKQGLSRLALILVALAPPLLFAFWYPGVFLHALTIAGGIVAVLLFGFLPAWMTLKQPLYSNRLVVIAVLCVALTLFTLQLLEELGFYFLPQLK